MNLLLFLLLFVAVVIVSALAVRAIGGDLRLIADWKKAWTFYSTWAFVVLGALPDISFTSSPTVFLSSRTQG